MGAPAPSSPLGSRVTPGSPGARHTHGAADHGGGVTSEADPRHSRRLSVRRLVVLPLVGLIRVYQGIVSPMRPATCRYYPSCSAYAVTALERFGLVKGTWLAARRLIRCHPWSPGGVDHVPPAPGP